ncbi:MAG: hypothetical protein A7315_10700 [Candidatus Altiarchaeales archaeon WOR_SM1_79]|nr:MAG: hypothetical protein A7315_10700 [Candidatus Altiarchaeales archaeon WOR_SM1_79]
MKNANKNLNVTKNLLNILNILAVFGILGILFLSGCIEEKEKPPIKPAFDLDDEKNFSALCSMKPDAGPCEAAIQRYYFDGEKCRQFLWGGCDGKVPFETLEDCQNSCETDEYIINDNPNSSVLPAGYALDSYTVEEITNVSCQENSECETPIDYLVQSRCPFTSICLDNKCTVVCPEFFEQHMTGEIINIEYKLDGSVLTVKKQQNVFEVLVSIPNLGPEYAPALKELEIGNNIRVVGEIIKLKDSERIIASEIYIINDDPNSCTLLPDPGICEAAITRYYFDQEESKCKQFIWGGCDGKVPFETLESCQTACEAKPNDTGGDLPKEGLKVQGEYETKVVYTTEHIEDKSAYEADCKLRGGVLNECGGACSPDAEVCPDVCALTCEFQEIKQPKSEPTTFKETLEKLAAQKVGQPIEGFDAHHLIQAFPGLLERDFYGVKTLEGEYQIIDEKLTFVRTKDPPATSAEQMITDEGYNALLQHLMGRFLTNDENLVIERIANAPDNPFCKKENVLAVSECNGLTSVVYNDSDKTSTYYRKDGTEVICNSEKKDEECEIIEDIMISSITKCIQVC